MTFAELESYRYFCYDINTNSKLGELPATACTFDTRLNDAGSFQADILLSNDKIQRRWAPMSNYGGWPFKLYVVRDPNSVVWAGYVWQVKYRKQTQKLTLSGKELLSFADGRTLPKDYTAAQYPSDADPAALLTTILSDVQSTVVSGPGASWGFQIITPPTGLYKITPGYPKPQKTTVMQVIKDLIQIIQPGHGGIDITATASFDAGGNPVDTLTIWYPRAGRNSTQTGVRLDLDKAIDYEWQADGSQGGTNIDITGAGNGAATPETVVQSPWTSVGGLGQPPRIDVVKAYTHIQTQSQISAMAGGVASVFGQPLLTPTVTIPSAGNLGNWGIGDDVLVVAASQAAGGSDPFFANGLRQDMRIVEYYTTLADFGVSQTKLTLNSPPAF